MLKEIKFNQIYRSLEISKVLDSIGIEYRDLGNELRFNCLNPEHKDRTPSCSINIENGSKEFGWFYCFGCGYSGGLLKLIVNKKECSVEEAREFVLKSNGEFGGLKVKRISKTEQINKIRLVSLPEEFISIEIGSNNSYEKYLKGRGVSEEEMKKYEWGYCFKGRYEKRVVLPIKLKNELIGFYARHITTDIEERKARNALDSNIGSVVFPYDELDFELDYLWLVEGAFDFFALRKFRLKNIVALMGNAISPWKLKLLKKFSEIRIVPDGDEGGETIIKSVVKKIGDKKIIKSVLMPDGEDAASLNQKELKKVLLSLSEIKLEEKFKPKTKADYSISKLDK